jgi:hypothetical protein
MAFLIIGIIAAVVAFAIWGGIKLVDHVIRRAAGESVEYTRLAKPGILPTKVLKLNVPPHP